MNVDAILVSDFAQVISGKLVVVGTLQHLAAKKFPAMHPMLAVSLIIHGHASEAGREFKLEVRLIDQDRKSVIRPLELTGRLPSGPFPPGLPVRAQLAHQILGLRFEREGLYAFEVYIDGTYHASASLYVQQVQQV